MKPRCHVKEPDCPGTFVKTGKICGLCGIFSRCGWIRVEKLGDQSPLVVGVSRMLRRFIVPGLLALLSVPGLAPAQGALGPPTARDANIEPRCAECKPEPTILGLIARKLFSPIRANAAPTPTPPPAPPAPPPPIAESGPTKQDIARMIIDGGYSPAEISAA